MDLNEDQAQQDVVRSRIAGTCSRSAQETLSRRTSNVNQRPSVVSRECKGEVLQKEVVVVMEAAGHP